MVFSLVFLGRRKFASITLLSIMLPMSLLAVFRMTGIVPEPPAPETTTLETVNWKMQRPSEYINFYSEINKSVYKDNFIAVSVLVVRYLENDDWYNGLDVINLMVFFKGYFSFVIAKFHPTDADSILALDTEYLLNPPRNPNAVINMIVTGVKASGTNVTEAYVKAKSTGSPSNLTIFLDWLFHDYTENNKDHTLKMTFEVTYFNGTTYRKIIAPAILEVLIGEV